MLLDPCRTRSSLRCFSVAGSQGRRARQVELVDAEAGDVLAIDAPIHLGGGLAHDLQPHVVDAVDDLPHLVVHLADAHHVALALHDQVLDLLDLGVGAVHDAVAAVVHAPDLDHGRLVDDALVALEVDAIGGALVELGRGVVGLGEVDLADVDGRDRRVVVGVGSAVREAEDDEDGNDGADHDILLKWCPWSYQRKALPREGNHRFYGLFTLAKLVAYCKEQQTSIQQNKDFVNPPMRVIIYFG